METIGYKRIRKDGKNSALWSCWNCGAPATRRVTYRSVWSSAVLPMCSKCSNLHYNELTFRRQRGLWDEQKVPI